MSLTASSFCPSRRTPGATGSEVSVRSNHTRTAVPSRTSRTTSSPTAPPDRAASARLTSEAPPEGQSPKAIEGRVPAPAGQAPAVRASTWRASRAWQGSAVLRHSRVPPPAAAIRPRHAEFHRAKAARQPAPARPVPGARRPAFRPPAPRAAPRRRPLQQVLDVRRTPRSGKPAHLVPDARPDLAETRSVCGWVKPGAACEQRRAVRFRLGAVLLQGATSTGVPTPVLAR